MMIDMALTPAPVRMYKGDGHKGKPRMLTKMKANAIPKKDRNYVGRFERSSDWKKMKAAIDAGLKPESKPGRDDAEALVLKLTDAEKEDMGITNRRTIARIVQKYVLESGLKYRVRSFRHDDMDFIVVEGEGA
jgi:hypothetical protein